MLDDRVGAPADPTLAAPGPVTESDRYLIHARRGGSGNVAIYDATDRWLSRPVSLVVSGAGEAEARSLKATGRSVARIKCPYVVEVFGSGNDGSANFVVCERPGRSLASVMADRTRWDGGRAVRVAREVAIGLGALHGAGVPTDGLDLGAVGLDDAGRVRVSPWPPADPVPAPVGQGPSEGDLALVAAILESAAPTDASGAGPAVETLAARVRHLADQRAALSSTELIALLTEPSSLEAAQPTGHLPVDQPTGQITMAPVSPAPAARDATGPPPVYRPPRRRSRLPWALAAVAGSAALIVVLLLGSGSTPAKPPTPAAGAGPSATTGAPTPTVPRPSAADPGTPLTTLPAATAVATPTVPAASTTVPSTPVLAATPPPTTPTTTTSTTTTTTVPSSTTTSTTTASAQ